MKRDEIEVIHDKNSVPIAPMPNSGFKTIPAATEIPYVAIKHQSSFTWYFDGAASDTWTQDANEILIINPDMRLSSEMTKALTYGTRL